jgi:hypothetical protein
MRSGVDRYLQKEITLSDGRTVTGRRPGHSASTLLEHKLRDVLARSLGGITEAVLPYGRADVMTTTRVFEVEPAAQWRHAVRQVLAYSMQCGLPPAIALFGEKHSSQVLSIYLKLRDGRPPVELWWYSHSAWRRISSRSACLNQTAAE